MARRRQLLAGITLLLLALAQPMSAIVLSRPTGGWEAATLLATALLLSAVCASRAIVVHRLSAVAQSVTGPAADPTPATARLSPDIPGRPQQPRAPGRGSLARCC